MGLFTTSMHLEIKLVTSGTLILRRLVHMVTIRTVRIVHMGIVWIGKITLGRGDLIHVPVAAGTVCGFHRRWRPFLVAPGTLYPRGFMYLPQKNFFIRYIL